MRLPAFGLVLSLAFSLARPVSAQKIDSTAIQDSLMRIAATAYFADTGAPVITSYAAEDSFPLTIPSIMRGYQVSGYAPSDQHWTADSKWIYFRWLPPGADWRERPRWYRVAATPGAKPQRVSLAEMEKAGPLISDGVQSRDGKWKAVSYEGDLYVIERATGKLRRLTQTEDAEEHPAFSADGTQLYFTRDNNVFALDLASGFTKQLTDIRAASAPEEKKAEGQRAALEHDQRELLATIADQARADSLAKLDKRAHELGLPKPLYLGTTERVSGLDVSPAGNALLIATTIPAKDERKAAVPYFVTESGYVEEKPIRTKVGDAQETGRVAFMSIPSGKISWLKITPGDTTHAPDFAFPLGWNPTGTDALLFVLSGDFKTRWIERVNGTTGALTAVDVLKDTAWVDGPCFGCGGWIDANRFWYVSEADGYAHLYEMNADGSGKRQLTSGKWEVQGVNLSPDHKWFYLTTNETTPFDNQLWRMSVDGGARTLLTTKAGGHDAQVSPDGSMIADVYSYSNRPPELFVLKNAAGAPMNQLTTSPTKAWRSFPWIDPQIVWITASDGVKVPARIYKPSDMHAQPNGAAVIFVHGAGYLQDVTHTWSYYAHEFMFDHLLASKGYYVLDMDYRGSAGYGRDWRVAIYRHMGGRDLQDEVDGSKWLGEQFGVPAERVGIWGGSYGGFMTLMALFTEPKHFGAGAAIRSVTDWAHYNNGYTGRILNLPQNDSVAYRQSSPIYFAQGLEDPLLMLHGMVDTNVHYQDIVRLEQRLIELHKTNWELASYPVESHGFVRPDSWQDEYRRIYELFENTIGKPTAAAASSTGAPMPGGR